MIVPIPSLCECGCNEIVWNGHRFRHGHNARINNPATGEGVGAKISNTKKGTGNPRLLGRRFTPEHRESLSKSLLQYTKILTKEYLIKEYVIKKKRTKDIGKTIGCSSSTIVDYLHRYNIPLNKVRDMSGKSNPMYGKHFEHTKSAKDKISKTSKERWSDSIFKDETVKRIRKAAKNCPNKPEQVLIDLFKEHNLPYKFVGDGSVIMYGLNPDFINCNGQKKIIELFGDYWHRDDVVKSWKATEFGRKAIFSQLGYKSLIIWETELKQMTDIELRDRVLEFNNE